MRSRVSRSAVLILLLASFFLSLSAANAYADYTLGDGRWFVRSPYFAATGLTDVDFVDLQHGWAVDWSGAILRTIDGGNDWIRVPQVTSKGLWAVAFTDASNGWVAGASGLILHTKDGGRTWETQHSGESAILNALHFIDSSRGWAAGAGGVILHTTDGGKTWTRQTSPTTRSLSAIDFVDAKVGYALSGDWTGSLLLSTVDGGAHWRVLNDLPDYMSTLDFADANHGYIAGYDGAYYTSDGGVTLRAPFAGNGSFYKVFALSATEAWGCGGGALKHTVDGGFTWQAVPDAVDGGAIEFVDPSHGWVVGGARIARTGDAGASWEQLGAMAPLNMGTLDLADEKHGWLVGTEGAYETTDGARTWVKRGPIHDPQDVEALTADDVFMLDEANYLYHSSDAGSTWTTITLNTELDARMNDVCFPSSKHGVVLGSEGYASVTYVTDDGGATWSDRNPLPLRNLYSLAFADDRNGWAVGVEGAIVHTTDGGSTWTTQSCGTTTAFLSAVSAVSSSTVWIGANSGVLVTTSDAGRTWRFVQTPAAGQINDVLFTDARHGFAGGDGFIVRTSDGGATWTLDRPGIKATSFSAVGTGTVFAYGSGFVVSSVPLDARNVDEIEGPDRYATAVQTCRHAFPDPLPLGAEGHRTVVLATGQNWPDALAASGLAGSLGCPMLLSPSRALPQLVGDEIERLKADRVILIGSEAALSAEVARDVLALSTVDSVERIEGADRYATSQAVVERTVGLQGGSWDGTVVVTTGRNYPDALSAASMCAGEEWPLLLVSDSRRADTCGFLERLKAKHAIVLGDARAVSGSLESSIAAATGGSERLQGADRYATSVAIGEFAASHLGYSFGALALATGEKFPDALVGGVLQGKGRNVLLLTRGSTLAAPVEASVAAHRADVRTVRYLGSDASISPAVRGTVSSVLR